MNLAPFLIIVLLLLGMLLFLVFYLALKVKKLENKNINVSYDDIKVITDNLRLLIVESERVSEKIDNTLKEKEATLEDLVALIDDKLIRLEQIDNAKKRNIDLFDGDIDLLDDKVEISSRSNKQDLQNKSFAHLGLKDKIVFLNGQGDHPSQIAKTLGISVTEVNLVLKHHI